MDNSIDKEEKEERATKRKRIGNITREEWEVGSQVWRKNHEFSCLDEDLDVVAM